MLTCNWACGAEACLQSGPGLGQCLLSPSLAMVPLVHWAQHRYSNVLTQGQWLWLLNITPQQSHLFLAATAHHQMPSFFFWLLSSSPTSFPVVLPLAWCASLNWPHPGSWHLRPFALALSLECCVHRVSSSFSFEFEVSVAFPNHPVESASFGFLLPCFAVVFFQ